MQGEYISINGKLVPVASAGGQLQSLLGVNYTYRNIHTLGSRPLHPGPHLDLLGLSYGALYGTAPEFDLKETTRRIGELLYRNKSTDGGNLVRLIAAPGEDPLHPVVFIFYCGPMMYPGYSLWHKPLRSLPLTYEIPFPAFKTSANLTAHNYSQAYARRMGYDCALTVNYAGNAVSLGEDPLFCVRGRDVFVADAEASSPQSVERLLGLELCRMAGLNVFEQAPPAETLRQMDELFSFSPQGIIPVGSVGEHRMPSTIVSVLEEYLPRLERAELAP